MSHSLSAVSDQISSSHTNKSLILTPWPVFCFVLVFLDRHPGGGQHWPWTSHHHQRGAAPNAATRGKNVKPSVFSSVWTQTRRCCCLRPFTCLWNKRAYCDTCYKPTMTKFCTTCVSMLTSHWAYCSLLSEVLWGHSCLFPHLSYDGTMGNLLHLVFCRTYRTHLFSFWPTSRTWRAPWQRGRSPTSLRSTSLPGTRGTFRPAALSLEKGESDTP